MQNIETQLYAQKYLTLERLFDKINMLGALWNAPDFLCVSGASGCREKNGLGLETTGKCSQKADKCTAWRDVRKGKTFVKWPMSKFDKKGQTILWK